MRTWAFVNLDLQRLKEARSLLRRTIPVARRALGESNELTLKVRWNYASALYKGGAARLDDLREAVTTYEDAARIARRVFGDMHPLVVNFGQHLQAARSALRARETPSTSA